MLKEQAISSISSKKFHCQSGSVYSLYPYADMNNAVKFIVALQTIRDYLDNLCDRAGVTDETAFRQLHKAVHNAVDLETLLLKIIINFILLKMLAVTLYYKAGDGRLRE